MHCCLSTAAAGVCPSCSPFPVRLGRCSAPCSEACSLGSWSASSSSSWSLSGSSEAATDDGDASGSDDWQCSSHPSSAESVLEGSDAWAPSNAVLTEHKTDEQWPQPYPGLVEGLRVGIKVDAPHEQLPEVGTTLVHALHSSIQQVAETAPEGCPPLCLVQAACFPGCVQLLAGMYMLPQGGPAGADGRGRGSGGTSVEGSGATSSSSSSGTPSAAAAGRAVSRWSRCGALANTLLAKAAAVMQGTAAGGSTGGVAAAVMVGSGASAAAAANRTTGLDAGGVGGGAITFIALDPPVAPAGCSGPVELFLHANIGPGAAAAEAAGDARGRGHSLALRLLLYNHEGVVVEQEVSVSEVQSSSIRVCLPALPVGVYHLALLPTAAARTPRGLGPAGPLLLQPLLVLPPSAAAELHQHWRVSLSRTAARADTRSEDQAGGDAWGGEEAHLLQVMQKAWAQFMQGLVTDMAYVVLATAAAAAGHAATAGASVGVQPSTGSLFAVSGSSSSSSNGGGNTDAGSVCAGMQDLLHSLMSYLARHQLAHSITALADILAGTWPRAPHTRPGASSEAQGVSQEPAIATLDSDTPSDSSSSRSSRADSCVPEGATGKQCHSNEEGLGCDTSMAHEESCTRVHPCGNPPAQGRSQWQVLLWGFPSAALEERYVEHVCQSAYPDILGAVFFLVFVASIGVLTDPYVAPWGSCPLMGVGWETAARCVFSALFVVPALLMVMCQRLLRGGRRERAQLARGACLVVAAWLVPLGFMPMTPSLARTLVNSWKSWCVVLLGMGLFNAVCRQIRARRLALPLLLEFAGWWAAAVWVEGYAAGPAALRFGCGYAAGMLISCVLELRSRERLAAVLTPDSGAAEASGCRAGGAESRARSKAEGLPTSCAAAGAAGASSMLKSSHAD